MRVIDDPTEVKETYQVRALLASKGRRWELYHLCLGVLNIFEEHVHGSLPLAANRRLVSAESNAYNFADLHLLD